MDATRRSLLRAGGGAVALGAAGALGYGQAVGSSGAESVEALVAGSLLNVATAVEGASVEAHGSAAVRRLVVEGLREPDAVALADPRLFEGVSDRATLFATNALVVAYDPESPHADALADDWRAIADPDVSVGRTDPDQDPLGYRTVMALELAERRGDVEADAVLESSTVFRETDLLNVLEQGAVDAAFAYRSMAAERGLPATSLPDAIDFSSPDHADEYAQASYYLDHRTVEGAPIRYAATATTPRGERWVEHLVSGRERLEANGFGVPESYPVRDARLEFDVAG